jgi:hypothetical protein
MGLVLFQIISRKPLLSEMKQEKMFLYQIFDIIHLLLKNYIWQNFPQLILLTTACHYCLYLEILSIDSTEFVTTVIPQDTQPQQVGDILNTESTTQASSVENTETSAATTTAGVTIGSQLPLDQLAHPKLRILSFQWVDMDHILYFMNAFVIMKSIEI